MGIADTPATMTPALIRSNGGRPDPEVMRFALYGWSFNTPCSRIRTRANRVRPRSSLARKQHAPGRRSGDPATLRAVMGAIGRKLDSRPAAASTSQRKRAVFHNALEYAVERKLLASNPLAAIRVTNQKTAGKPTGEWW